LSKTQRKLSKQESDNSFIHNNLGCWV